MFHRMLPRRMTISAATLAATAMFAAGAQADPVAEFYKGKTVEIIVSTGAGTGHDTSVRLLARHLRKHIPGEPSIIARNMPGGGHVRAANYVHNTAPKDGTTLASILPAFVLHQLIDGRGVEYDAANFIWLGSSLVDNMNLYVWHTANVKSFEEVMTREVVMGATGAGSYAATFPSVLNNVLGTKFKIVTGYRTTGEIHLALERGEVQGRAGNFFSSLKSNDPEWLAQKKIDILLQIGTERDPEFPDIPLMSELAKTPEQRRVLELFSGEIAMGRAYATTPGVPADRVAALRKAFMDTMKDKDFLAESAKLSLPVRPVSHDRLEEIVNSILTTPPELVEMARKAKFGDNPPK